MIKRRMEAVGTTQEQLAEALDMTQGGLGHWLNGKRQPPFEKLIEIADALGIDRATLGAALLEAPTGSPATLPKPVATPKAKGSRSQLMPTGSVDLDLLHQILEGQEQIREEFKTAIVEIRSGSRKGSRSKSTDLVEKQK
jgi:transcriptional regulator with XRE-family HTH domain